MAFSITLARIVRSAVPIQWQEAVAVALTASQLAERQNRRLTLHGCTIAADGTVRVGEDGSDRVGPALSELQMVRVLLERSPKPAQLEHLLTAADDALAVFPSERDPNGAPLKLASFLQPNATQQIARLARRGLTASREAGEETAADAARSESAGAVPDARPVARPTASTMRTFGWRAAIMLGLLLVALVVSSFRGTSTVSVAARAIVGVVEETAAAVGLTPGAPHELSHR